jgi:hypothetical protein
MKQIKCPWIVDVMVEDRPDAIRAAAMDPDLDRGYRATGPLLNRLRVKDVRRTLQLHGQAFPTVLPRDDRGRAEARDSLWARLNEIAPAVAQGQPEVEDLAEFVRGSGDADRLGPLVQQLVGRLFAPDYRSSAETWAAALALGRAAGTTNPLMHLWWRVTGRVRRAREILSAPVGCDLAAVNATGIAMHHLVHGLKRMRDLYSEPAQRRLAPAAAALRCLHAPTVIRQPVSAPLQRPADRPLVLLDLQAAFDASGDSDLVFLRNTWSVCPGEAWAPALLEGVWLRANRAAK